VASKGDLTLSPKWAAVAVSISSYPHVHALMKKYVVGGKRPMRSRRPSVAIFYRNENVSIHVLSLAYMRRNGPLKVVLNSTIHMLYPDKWHPESDFHLERGMVSRPGPWRPIRGK